MASQNDSNPENSMPPMTGDEQRSLLQKSSLGSGLLAKQPTPAAEEAVAVARVCPQCGGEYETGDRFCPKDGTPLRPKSGGDPLVGRVIADRYLILARLGEGGMGRVYLAEHVKMNRQCAVKVMNPQLVHDHESLQRFAREASSAARIIHPNVAAVFDYGEADKVVYLVMEYVDGESLSSLLTRERGLEPRRAVEIGRQIADGLHAAHELGIIHRDLKPDNVIVTQSRGGKEVPKVVDFGIAKAMGDSPQDALTRSGLVIGTPEFMSPEQLLGDPVDARADIYSLGCILYQMLTGEQAFAAESREQMIRRRLHEAPPHIRDVIPNLPRRLDTLIFHMLARSPSDRLASAAEVRDALEPSRAFSGFDRGSGGARLPTPNVKPNAKGARISRDPSLQPTMPLARVQLEPERPRTSIKRIVGGVIVGAGLLAGGLTLWVNYQDSFDPAALLRRLDPRRSTPPAAVVVADTTPVKKPVPAKTTATVPKTKPATATAALTAAAAPGTTAVVRTPRDSAFIRPLDKLTKAIGSADLDLVTKSFPGISLEQRQKFDTLFTNADHLKATSTYGAASVNGERAEMSYDVHLRFLYKNSSQQVVTTLRYRAEFAYRFGGWQLTSVKEPGQ